MDYLADDGIRTLVARLIYCVPLPYAAICNDARPCHWNKLFSFMYSKRVLFKAALFVYCDS